jgi:hypothetical protein
MSTCKSCGAAIRWARLLPSMKAHPLNAEPSEGGNIDLAEDTAAVLTKGQLASARAKGSPLYTSHFSSCPQAAQHRRAK